MENRGEADHGETAKNSCISPEPRMEKSGDAHKTAVEFLGGLCEWLASPDGSALRPLSR